MAITKIHGFKPEAEKFSSRGNQFVLDEIVIVEADSPSRTLAEVVDYLPSAVSGPGPVNFNPLGLTFTLKVSTHPYSPLYYLDSVQGMSRENKGDRFWKIPLTYMTSPPLDSSFLLRRDQKVKNPDDEAKNQTFIANPLERPPVWTGSTSTTYIETFHDANNNLIRHTNGLPITNPVRLPVDAVKWQWEFNVDVSGFTLHLDRFERITSTCNADTFTIEGGKGGTFTIPKKTMKCTGCSYTEHWETVQGQKTQFHYIRVTIGFERQEFREWDKPPVSMHTKELVNPANPGQGVKPIVISNAGAFAKEPWPLQANGAAVPFAQIENFNPANMGRLQAAGADLKMMQTYDFASFFNLYNLKLPVTTK